MSEAGECFARGLALLVGTQFTGEMYWNPEPIRAAHDRWRIEFSWVAVANGRSLEHDDEDENDETEEISDDDEGRDGA